MMDEGIPVYRAAKVNEVLLITLGERVDNCNLIQNSSWPSMKCLFLPTHIKL
jgi:hypothetical protein